MKIYIDYDKRIITNIEADKILYYGENYEVITIDFNKLIDTAIIYPSLSATLADGKSIYPRLYDTGGLHEENNHTIYTFTLTSDNGWNLIAGKTNFFVWLTDTSKQNNICCGTFNCNIVATSGYYQVEVPSLNPKLQEEINEILKGYARESTSVKANTTANIIAKTSNDGIYVSTTNSEWYYWNGEQYVTSGIKLVDVLLGGLSQAQKNALDSGITSDKITSIDTKINGKVDSEATSTLIDNIISKITNSALEGVKLENQDSNSNQAAFVKVKYDGIATQVESDTYNANISLDSNSLTIRINDDELGETKKITIDSFDIYYGDTDIIGSIERAATNIEDNVKCIEANKTNIEKLNDNLSQEITDAKIREDELKSDYNAKIEVITTKISDNASSSNKLIDKSYVDESDGTITAKITNVTKRLTEDEVNIDTLKEKLTSTTEIANEAKTIAEGRAKATAYATEDDMKAALVNAGKLDFKVGDNLLIIQDDVPDYWITKVNDNKVGMYGFFNVAVLETEKTDLSNYYNKNETNEVIKKMSYNLKATFDESTGELMLFYANSLDRTYFNLKDDGTLDIWTDK